MVNTCSEGRFHPLRRLAVTFGIVARGAHALRFPGSGRACCVLDKQVLLAPKATKMPHAVLASISLAWPALQARIAVR